MRERVLAAAKGGAGPALRFLVKKGNTLGAGAVQVLPTPQTRLDT